MIPELLTLEEMKELDDLLNRYDDLTDNEMKRLNELHANNEASLMPYGLDVLFEFLSR
jgi:hypothetical protein